MCSEKGMFLGKIGAFVSREAYIYFSFSVVHFILLTLGRGLPPSLLVSLSLRVIISLGTCAGTTATATHEPWAKPSQLFLPPWPHTLLAGQRTRQQSCASHECGNEGERQFFPESSNSRWQRWTSLTIFPLSPAGPCHTPPSSSPPSATDPCT